MIATIIPTCSDILDVFVRFDPTSYTTTESQGSVTVWVHVDEGVSAPFTVALLPGEGDGICSFEVIIHALFYVQVLRSLSTIYWSAM